ncbi:Double C2-like domain-containing protein beta [Trichinella spiralis]|uniref:Double C2-like domain-containing protein beta n=1 Tax=Trichinella spiralis TaxID=6334 RepID=A0ABR3K9T7_TRISP
MPGKQSSWICPSDRFLILRSQLSAGWSVWSDTQRADKSTISDNEMQQIKDVIARAEHIEENEQRRIGKLVERLDRMKKMAAGNGINQCMLCGAKFGMIGTRSFASFCHDCNKYVCQKNCGLETLDSNGQTIYLCKLCSETREMWKKSGAWFYKGFRILLKIQVCVQKATTSLCSKESLPSWSGKAKHAKRLLPTPPSESHIRPSQPRWAIISQSIQSFDKCVDSSSEEEEEDSKDEQETEEDIDQNNENLNRSLFLDDSDTPYSRQSSCLSELDNSKPLSELESPELKRLSEEEKRTANDVKEETEIYDSKSSISEVAVHSDSPVQSCTNSSSRYTMEIAEDSDASIALSTSVHDQATSEVNKIADQLADCSMNKPYATTTLQHSDSAKSFDSSLYDSSPDNDITSFGSLEYSLLYDETEEMLVVTIFQASNLPAMDSNGFSDPYVKLHLLPLANKSTKLRTSTKWKTLNPRWNERLIYYGMSKDDLRKKTLRLMVLDQDRIGSDFLGETRAPLKRLQSGKEKYFNVYLEKQMPVEKCDEFTEERGKILLALCYDLQNKLLAVEVVRCAELVGMDSTGYSDPYVKLTLKPGALKSYHVKTEVKKKTLNPEYNRVFQFPVSYDELAKKSLDVEVWDKDVGKLDDFIGSVTLSANAKSDRLKHWIECIQNPNKRIKKWHKLTGKV